MTEGERLILIRDELVHVQNMYKVLLKDNIYLDLYKTLTGYYDVDTAIYRIDERLIKTGESPHFNVAFKEEKATELKGLCELAARENNK